ncbi:uncharacterized protein LOC143178282 [Calliopsis andreniformis]|uniref:uncharacterized protein LOC143178282 n=1 Tax=Calliopsis andreniformis TaxID=337506 RepID=UPI003FCE9FC1
MVLDGKKQQLTQQWFEKRKKRIERNPRRSANKMEKELSVSHSCFWSIQKILKTELKLKPYKIQKVHDRNAAQMKIRLDRAKELKRLAASGEIPNIVFSDEKIFTIEQYGSMVMVWAAVTADGRSPLVFLKLGIKVNATVYREKVLKAALKPWTDKHFGGRS